MHSTLDLFSKRTREEGARLFARGDVRITDLKDGKVGRSGYITAEALDGGHYRVRVEIVKRGAALSCTCPAISSSKACAHLWAVLMEAFDLEVGERWIRKQFSKPVVDAVEEAVESVAEEEIDAELAELLEGRSADRFKLRDLPGASWGAFHRGAGIGSVPPGGVRPPAGGFGAPRSKENVRRGLRPWETALRTVEAHAAMERGYVRRADAASLQPFDVRFLVTPGWIPELPVELEIVGHQRTRSGAWGKLKTLSIPYSDLSLVESAEDALIIRRLSGSQDARIPEDSSAARKFLLRTDLFVELAPQLAARGRLLGMPPLPPARANLHGRFDVRDPKLEETIPLTWEGGEPWRLQMVVDREKKKDPFRATLRLVRGSESVEPDTVEMFPRDFAISGGRILRVDGEAPRPWMVAFQQPREIGEDDLDDFVRSSMVIEGCPIIEAPEEARWAECSAKPIPHFVISGPGELPDPPPEDAAVRAISFTGSAKALAAHELAARVEFDYEGTLIDERRGETRVLDAERRTVVRRQPFAEAEAMRILPELGVTRRRMGHSEFLVFVDSKLPSVVGALVDRGWKVFAKDTVFRAPGAVRMRVSSGIDWFGVDVSVAYENGVDVALPRILEALKRGEKTVRLGDGTVGFLPQEWLQKNGLLLEAGKLEGGELRFGEHQAALLDALLASQPEVAVDETFDRIRREIRSFEGVTAVDPPRTFQADLRDYQKDSLAWFAFLRRFGFGGCLADDMGLGKTIMVLALLESRRGASNQKDRGARNRTEAAEGAASGKGQGERRPSLVVVPRSLVFNWLFESARFAPRLRVLDHSGHGRGDLASVLADSRADVVLTTYGVLRRDILQFKDTLFDYAILDESQAIKNHWTSTSKAVRLLQARHRLAMSGTPVENHLGELWSLFDFLNPGLLGSSRRFQKWASATKSLSNGSTAAVGAGSSTAAIGTGSSTAAPGPGEEPGAMELLTAVVRPFVLRRTKAQVAKQLPEKVEQTVYCTLGKAQRRLYESLRTHYQELLLGEGAGDPGGNNAVLVLEGLLRLRQAACHAALIDRDRIEDGAAKLDVLLERLLELREEGHKALVFSQFVALLKLVQARLDEAGIRYEYLDGKTRNRAERVERFQNDPNLDVFLISLKAGGTGLNLTAATYVFLLDPWWNPAVEMQAIDRTHRIGQTRSVLACRLVARDTVEERILELQERKRNLADSIIQADRGLLQNIGREDLELLLS